MLKCQKCHSYSLIKECKCGGVCVNPHPQKYSVEDKYAKYRRMCKYEGQMDNNNP
ncbi:MAG: RNA-protein complex protein Nop10 [Nanoarchaeota archaeon]|nr:RNA-protein complex protein Nop10 [Nanoarchaeota archaeon]MBU1029617.1 RNA-protein complex protein Nop10 [Nanoarchaeota archaeon]MBU1850230.1 RNA-protein complex protein Nop10 [Nanoarchaeota archaeon]